MVRPGSLAGAGHRLLSHTVVSSPRRTLVSARSRTLLCSSEVIAHMRIGYAPGRCLRAWRTQLGCPASALRQAGLVNAIGNDSSQLQDITVHVLVVVKRVYRNRRRP